MTSIEPVIVSSRAYALIKYHEIAVLTGTVLRERSQWLQNSCPYMMQSLLHLARDMNKSLRSNLLSAEIAYPNLSISL